MSVMPAGAGGYSYEVDDAAGAAASAEACVPAEAPEEAAPASFDAGTIDDVTLAQMKTSPDAATKKLGHTIANARVAFADSIAAGGRILVTTSPGNGNEPVVVAVPPGFDPSKPAQVQTHYHGFCTTAADPKGAGAGTTARVEEVQAQNPQAIFVLPECRNFRPEPVKLGASTGNGQLVTDWSNVSSPAQTATDALRAAGVPAGSVQERVISAHSGGGAALAYALTGEKEGKTLKNPGALACDRLELHDSLYGSETAIGLLGNSDVGAAVKEVAYYRGNNAPAKADGVKAAFGDRFGKVECGTPPLPKPTAADNPLMLKPDGAPVTDVNGKTRTKWKFDGTGHDRTNGQFLGAGLVD